MTATANDLADAGRLISYAARPKEVPARNVAYRALVRRYLDDQSFAGTCETIAAGLGLTLRVDEIAGVVAVAEPDSPMRMQVSEFMRRSATTERRALNALVLLGIAHTAFPDPAHVDDEARVARFAVASVVDYLNRTCERLAEAGGDRLAGSVELNELWRAWHDLKQTRHDAQRDSARDRVGLVRKVCKFLDDEGMLAEVGADDGGTYRATQRFRIAVAGLLEDSDVFAELLAATSDLAGSSADEVGA